MERVRELNTNPETDPLLVRTHYCEFTFPSIFIEDRESTKLRNPTAHARSLCLLLFAFAGLFVARAQTIIPQIVDGGGWQTTLVFTNTSSNSAQSSVTFYQETGGGATAPWVPLFVDTNTPQSITIPAGGTVLIHSAGTALTTTIGWALIQGDSSVSAYAIYAQSVTGRPNQDATTPALTASSRVIAPYDNTGGFVTSLAIANAAATSASISVGLQNTNDAGPVSPAPAAITLPPLGHMSFTMPQQFPATANQSGTAEFTAAAGSISLSALRFDPTGSFASPPTYAEIGGAILGGGGNDNGSGNGGSGGTTGGGNGGANACTSTGGPIPAFQDFSVDASGPNIQSLSITYVNFTGTASAIQVSGRLSDGTSFDTVWTAASTSGNTLTFGGFVASMSSVSNGSGTGLFNSASLSITLSPQSSGTAGSVCGTINLVGNPVSISGAFTGTYTGE